MSPMETSLAFLYGSTYSEFLDTGYSVEYSTNSKLSI